MSACVISHRHISALVAAGIDFKLYFGRGREAEQVTFENAERVGRALLDECVRSVRCRYPGGPDEELPRDDDFWREYKFVHEGERPLADLLSLVRSYRYQSCEHPEFRQSAAYEYITDLIEEIAKRAVGRSAVWGLSGEPEQDLKPVF